MFFILSKIVGFFALPSDIAATLGVVLLLIAGLTPLGNALMLPLEERFPPWDVSHGAPTGIIVLGGAVGPELSAARKTPDLNESAERLTATAALARQYPQARIVYSGGNARLVLTGGIEADYAIDLLESLGVARAPVDRVGFDRETGAAKNADRTRHVIGRGDEQPALARLGLGDLLAELGVLDRVARLALGDDARARDTEALEQIDRVVGLYSAGDHQARIAAAVDDARLRIFLR